MTKQAIRGVLVSAAFSAALVCNPAYAQTAGQDMHDAGHETKNAGSDVAHGTAHATKTVAHKTAHGTKTAAHKTAHGTKKAWHKTENLGDRVADKPETH
ncbi:MAG: hypothetical protein M3O02_05385 [Acidobacteriota bacterium]|nr:hypothetical protein [Acidobacteriota bacterium]